MFFRRLFFFFLAGDGTFWLCSSAKHFCGLADPWIPTAAPLIGGAAAGRNCRRLLKEGRHVKTVDGANPGEANTRGKQMGIF